MSLRCSLTPAKNQHLSLQQSFGLASTRFSCRRVALTALLEDFLKWKKCNSLVSHQHSQSAPVADLRNQLALHDCREASEPIVAAWSQSLRGRHPLRAFAHSNVARRIAQTKSECHHRGAAHFVNPLTQGAPTGAPALQLNLRLQKLFQKFHARICHEPQDMG